MRVSFWFFVTETNIFCGKSEKSCYHWGKVRFWSSKSRFLWSKVSRKTKNMTIFDSKIIKHCHQKWVRAQYHWGFQNNIFYNFYLQYWKSSKWQIPLGLLNFPCTRIHFFVTKNYILHTFFTKKISLHSKCLWFFAEYHLQKGISQPL